MADDFGYHIDHHGSLVRPPQLLAARGAGLSGDELAAVTDEAVVALAHALRRLTLNAMCDGQYRRAYFESVIHDQVAGFGLASGGPAPLSDLAGIGAPRRRAVPDAASGYDATAVAALPDETPFPRIGVDYPAEAATRFPVELVKPGIVVSRGAVDVSMAALEPVGEILDRIDPVADERGDADIAVATNGGFAQVADQPLMSEPQQRAKLQLGDRSPGYCWGNEI